MALVWRTSLLLLVVAYAAESQKASQCGEPPRYPDKELDQKMLLQNTPLTKVNYKCPQGQVRSKGSKAAFCQNGQWTRSTLQCTRKKCSALPDIINGHYDQSGTLYGDKAIAICNSGFVLTGNLERVCLWDGWNGSNPVCEESNVSCSLLPVDSNRRTSPAGKSLFAPGETITISCNQGYRLIGSSEVRCGADGQWEPLPKCEAESSLNSGNCGAPPSPPEVYLRDGIPLLKEFPSGAHLRYRCQIGFRRATGSDIIRCQGGQWSELRLRCKRKNCGSAGEISFGRFEYTGVSFGDTATAVCQEGYEFAGSGTRVCRDGGWDGRTPVCEPLHCPPPPEVKDAEVSDFKHEFVPVSHVVSYRCLSGTLIGSKDIYCTNSGIWNGPPPQCKDIRCPPPRVPRGSRMRGFRSFYRLGHTVTITCSPGRRLSGEASITCGADGTWKPELPECDRWN